MNVQRVVIFAAFTLACGARGDAARTTKTDVCAIWSHPDRFIARQLGLDTHISADGMHLALLMGSSCERGIRFTFARSVPQATQEAISKAIFQPWPGTSGKHISAHFEGSLRKYPSQPPMFPYVFEITSVANLRIKIGKRPW